MKTCEMCKFWVRDNNTENEGECRFDYPKPFITVVPNALGQLTQNLICVFPRTRSNVWCGRFEFRPESIQ